MRKILPILMALGGVAAGIGAGLAVHPTPEKQEDSADTASAREAPPAERDYVRLSQQFVVPVVEDERVAAMVVLALSLETTPGASDAVFAREPKLRDALLQVMFDHANTGGFDGAFTDAAALDPLRRQLTEAAQAVLPDTVSEVLVVEVARQDL